MFKTLEELRSEDRVLQPTAWRLVIRWAGGVIIAVLQFQAIYTALLEVD